MKGVFCVTASCAALRLFAGLPAEISVDVKLDEINYVTGERIRAVVDIKNISPDTVSVGYLDSPDRFFVEVFRAADYSQLERTKQKPFVDAFILKTNEGQKFETFLGDRYDLTAEGRYLARPVLVHGGTRFEGQYRAFDIVPGTKMMSAMQMFASHKNLKREFTIVRWTRRGYEHLFLKAHDEGEGDRTWKTTDIGPYMKLSKPVISILPGGEVVIIHRNGTDSFCRSEFWSMPDALELRSRTAVLDPETAGQTRVRQIYEEAGGVQPDERPWWKFW